MSPTHQMIITAMLVLLCYPSQVTFASIAQCTETNSIANRVLVGHAFFTKQSPDIEDCVISCINRDPLCDSTNYYRETKVCELNDKNAESNPDDLVDYEWAIYMTNNVRFLRCNNFDYECERQTDICQIKQGGNKCEGKNQTAIGFEKNTHANFVIQSDVKSNRQSRDTFPALYVSCMHCFEF